MVKAHAGAKPYHFGTGHLLDAGKQAGGSGFRSIMAYKAEGHKERGFVVLVSKFVFLLLSLNLIYILLRFLLS